jgi:hypothetical protein
MMRQVHRDIEEAAIRMLDRQRKTMRRVIFISFVVAAMLAWAMMGFVYLLVVFLR